MNEHLRRTRSPGFKIGSRHILTRTLMQFKKTVYGPITWGVIFSIILVADLLLSGCNRREKKASLPVPEVGTVTIQPQQVVLTTELPGRTCAYRVAEIRPQVNGIIQKRLFTEGSDVKAGQVLYQIDPAPGKAALDSAKATLAKSEANLPVTRLKFQRYKELLAEKAVCEQDYDDREAALKQAEADTEYCKAAVETARINLDYTRVTAPISGRIGKSNVTDGALVTAYQPLALATIQQLDPIYVDVPRSTTELLRLRRRLADGYFNQDGKNRNKVKIILEDGTTYSLEGKLEFRDVTVDPTTGSVTLRIVVPNPDGVLLPGMFVRAVVEEGVDEKAILVPQQGVSRTPKGEPFVYVVNNAGKVEQRMLTLNRAIGDKWLVSSGLSAGDRVVVEGMLNIRHGSPVKVVSANLNNQKARVEAAKAKLPPVAVESN
jgi:membrane fusion protein, multidrug efflux system